MSEFVQGCVAYIEMLGRTFPNQSVCKNCLGRGFVFERAWGSTKKIKGSCSGCEGYGWLTDGKPPMLPALKWNQRAPYFVKGHPIAPDPAPQPDTAEKKD